MQPNKHCVEDVLQFYCGLMDAANETRASLMLWNRLEIPETHGAGMLVEATLHSVAFSSSRAEIPATRRTWIVA